MTGTTGPTARAAARRALLLHGGWEGHEPDRSAAFAEERLLGGFDVVRADDPGVLRPEVLCEFDVLLPVWTFGSLSVAQESALLDAVAAGMGVVAWHGAASAFLASRAHKHLLGGAFVAHPGDEGVTYTVRFSGDDPLVEGLGDLTVTTEQYHLLVDPAVKVLATTRMDGAAMDWLAGVEMPVAWSRRWGRGRVFYCSLGHRVSVLEHGTVCTLLRRAAVWAASGRDAAPPRASR